MASALSELRLVCLAALVAMAPAGCKKHSEVTVLCAASLHPVLAEAAKLFQKEHPKVRVHLAPSGSQVAARKISEIGMRADIVAVADAAIIDNMLIPAHASWNVHLCTNEIVIAHLDHSRFTEEIRTDNWAEILLRPEVRLACANPDTAPLGYRTRLVWQLAGGRRKDIATPPLEALLADKCPAENLVPDEIELVSVLQSRAIDYAFVYRSTAELHHMKITALAPEVNLSRPELAASYREASITVRMKQAQDRLTVRGEPITYGLTIVQDAPNPSAARAFVAFLLGEQGRRLFERMGFRAPAPAPCRSPELAPAELRPLLRPAP